MREVNAYAHHNENPYAEQSAISMSNPNRKPNQPVPNTHSHCLSLVSLSLCPFVSLSLSVCMCVCARAQYGVVLPFSAVRRAVRRVRCFRRAPTTGCTCYSTAVARRIRRIDLYSTYSTCYHCRIARAAGRGSTSKTSNRSNCTNCTHSTVSTACAIHFLMIFRTREHPFSRSDLTHSHRKSHALTFGGGNPIILSKKSGKKFVQLHV